MVKARIMGDNDGAYASELRAMLRPSSSAAISTSA
jgi:glutamate-ammonia-ligase adenylyltransferase